MEELTFSIQDKEVAKVALSNIKEELDEHLDGINANTEEIQSNYTKIRNLEEKVTKLSEKIDVILGLFDSQRPSELSIPEQKVFMALFASVAGITSVQISAKIEIPLLEVEEIIKEIQHKGVLLQTHMRKHRLFYKLVQSYKENEARMQLLSIDERILRYVDQ